MLARMGVRLDPSDEYMHELGPESNFNESMYINCFDPLSAVGGWFRTGNRANEGYAEMTVCLYLPGGRVGFMFKRPNIDNNDRLDAAGLTWTMVKPFEELRVDYVGKVVVLNDPKQMVEPREAFKNNPYAEAEVHLTFTGQGRPSMFGGEPDTPHEAPGEEFAKGHYEQLVQAHGTIRVGDRECRQRAVSVVAASEPSSGLVLCHSLFLGWLGLSATLDGPRPMRLHSHAAPAVDNADF